MSFVECIYSVVKTQLSFMSEYLNVKSISGRVNVHRSINKNI